jgi:DnaK suppressor protein
MRSADAMRRCDTSGPRPKPESRTRWSDDRVSAMDTEHARELLAAARARVEQALVNASVGEPTPDADDNSGDDASELTASGVDDALAESLGEDLAAIERAEQRLADGTYGLSVESGDPISDGRLEASPWAERTVEEQERYAQGT